MSKKEGCNLGCWIKKRLQGQHLINFVYTTCEHSCFEWKSNFGPKRLSCEVYNGSSGIAAKQSNQKPRAFWPFFSLASFREMWVGSYVYKVYEPHLEMLHTFIVSARVASSAVDDCCCVQKSRVKNITTV